MYSFAIFIYRNYCCNMPPRRMPLIFRPMREMTELDLDSKGRLLLRELELLLSVLREVNDFNRNISFPLL